MRSGPAGAGTRAGGRAAEHRLHPDRRPALRRRVRARPPVPGDASPRPADRTRRAVRERLRDDVAVFAEPGVDSHRDSTLTGIGVLDNRTRLDPATPTFPQELQRAGYRTAFVGKWHMGGTSDEPRPGFDRWVSFPGQGLYYNQTFNIDGERVPRQGYTTDLITDYALDFLAARAGSEEPFLLYVSHKAVHASFRPAERHLGSYAGQRYPPPATMPNRHDNYEGKPNWVEAQRRSWHGVDGLVRQHGRLPAVRARLRGDHARRRRQRGPDRRSAGRTGPAGRDAARVHVGQRLPVRRARPDRQADDVRGVDPGCR